MGGTRNAPFATANVHHLARILFHVNALDADMGNIAALFLRFFQIHALLSRSAVHL